jgi:hypothetical protein
MGDDETFKDVMIQFKVLTGLDNICADLYMIFDQIMKTNQM